MTDKTVPLPTRRLGISDSRQHGLTANYSPPSKNRPVNAENAPKDQLAESRRVLNEMNDRADRAADEQVARSSPMTPKK
jgi:hypothetical protein